MENEQINLSDIPLLADTKMESLSLHFLKKWMLSRFIQIILISTLLLGYILISDIEIIFYIQLSLISYSILIIFFIIWPLWAFRYRAFAIREHDIIYQKGMIWQRKTVLPFNRIQHLEIKQDPLDKFFRLKSIKFYTAGGDNGDLQIDGIFSDSAESLKSFISERIGKSV